MWGSKRRRLIGRATGFLARLRSDQRGNALMMMAAMMIPLAGLTGSAIDMGRLYAVKSRLQQACDAGALAGRKMMTDTSSSTLEPAAVNAATTFFDNNFKSGWYQASAVSFTPTKISDSEVQGTASATVPMTIMQMFFQVADKTVTVSCTARYDVADSDIIFVLDTTGSMACTAANVCPSGVSSYTRPDGTTGYYDNEASGSKISGLRTAVLNFYDTLTASVTDPSTHVRYGFITYTSTVNVGKQIYALSPSYLVNTKVNYQTRQLVGDQNKGSATNATTTNTTQAACNALAGRFPTSGYNTNGTAKSVTVAWSPASNGTCVATTQQLQPQWRYGQYPQDISGYVAGNSILDPTKVTGASATWQGCIEEVPTQVGATSYLIGALPPDLDPDLVPSASVDANNVATSTDTRWRPMFPEAVYYRTSTGVIVDSAPNSSNPLGDNSSYWNAGSVSRLQSGTVSCGKPAVRLKTMTRSDIDNYVNAVDFKAIGSTYHDTGMIWGTRLISPTGIFANDTAAWPGRPAPNRYIIFMTDGQMAPNQQVYGMYGMEELDQRVTGGSFPQDTNYHNGRFLAECAAAKARNITVFTIGFGTTLTSQLKTCASPGKAFQANDNASLNAAFQQIAQQVAMLRLSK